MAEALGVSYADVEAAARRLAGVAHRTPLMTSRALDELTGARVFLKCENFQRVGAFKFRGAYNALAALPESDRRRGVLAYSSGNHAQAVALAARLLDAPATIVMPDDAPALKLSATRGYGARVITYRRTETTREALADELLARSGATLIPPYDHRDVIAGQGTAAREMIEELRGRDGGGLDALFVPVGGGGLISGCALTVRALLGDACRIVGVEPEAADDATRSFHTGVLHTVRDPATIADGARTPSLGKLTFPILRALVNEMITVSDAALIEAMRFCIERLKIVVEPTGVLGLAGLLARRDAQRGRRVGVVISGGNIDAAVLSRLLTEPAPAG